MYQRELLVKRVCMQTLNAILIVLAFLLIGLVMFCAALYLAEKVMGRKVALGFIFKEFRQKMWMTAGLGCVFFGLYLLTATLGYYYNDPAARLGIFFAVYENPSTFIYFGLITFAAVSTSIYAVRLIIKRLYNSTNNR